MKIRKGHTVELNIGKTAYGGKGVARMDGLVIFVGGAIPGDRVAARVVRKKKGLCRGENYRTADAIT